MRFLRVKTAEEEGCRQAMALYIISFPLHEQRMRESQTHIINMDAYHMELIEENGELLGAIFFWETDAFLYVEHFCMKPAVRGNGFGGQALELLARRGKPVILEIDPPVDEVSRRRKGFYQRCGFRENPYFHVHPAYRSEYQGHELVVMSYPAKLDEAAYQSFFAYLRNVVMAV